jgi:CRP-like cAMP-binding protein
VPLLCDLSAYYLLEQAEIAEWYGLGAGGRLFAQGDEGDALYIICQGELEVRVGERAVAKVGPGECVGELALLDGEPRSASAVASADVTLLKIAAGRFKHLLVTQPAAARALLRTLDKRIRETQASPTPQLAPGPRMRRSQLMRAQKLGLQQLVSTMSFLRQVDLFRDLPTPSLANLAGIAQEVTVYEGDTLFEEGDSGESLYLVCSGQIEVSVNERRLTVLERNACLGEMALLGGLPRSATATALREGRLLRIGSDDFINLLSHEAEIAIALLRTLAGRLRDALKLRAAPG